MPYFSGHWHSTNVHATFTGPWGGIKLAFVYMFILGLVGVGHARRAPRSPPSTRPSDDTHMALRRSAMFMLLVCILVPLGLGGVDGVPRP